VNLRQVDALGPAHRLGVNLGATNDEDLFHPLNLGVGGRFHQRFFQIVDHVGVGCPEAPVASDATPGQTTTG